MMRPFHSVKRFSGVLGLCGLIMCASLATPVQAQVTAFKQAVAETAARDDDIATYYRENGYQPVWTVEGEAGTARRKALMAAIQHADDHGLPSVRYNFEDLYQMMADTRSPRDLGLLEVAMSKSFLAYARDVQTGMFVPSSLDSGIARKAPLRDRQSYLTNLVSSADAQEFFDVLPPQNMEYVRLMKEKLRLERVVANGGWGPKAKAKKLKPGDSGEAVVALRNRLISMGYINRSASRSYDAPMQKAVQAFQLDHGLEADGVAGAATISAANRSAKKRLQSVIVAMERERWLNLPDGRGERHVLVNLADFHARVVDDGKVTFKTRSVVGKNQHDRRSPEFSDVMEHMVINPTWNVPRSIATKEYLPMLQKNPNAVSYLKVIDGSGRVVNRANVDFTQYSARSFPFDIKQAPGRRNALGLVKFMFPNKHNIYLHDTPSKSLFARETRAFSHGCIRLQQPFDFAYTLLARQESEPVEFFQTKLKTGRETKVDLDQPIPVHIIYRTAFTNAKGPVQYRRDIYGRDAKIWEAMANEGVVLRSVQG